MKPSKDRRSRASVFSRLFFLWFEPLFWIGCRRSLIKDDLATYPIPNEAASKHLLKQFNKHWEHEIKMERSGRRKAHLSCAILKCLWWRFLFGAFLSIIYVFAKLFQSIVLGYLTDYFIISEPTSDDTRNAYIYATALLTGMVVQLLFEVHAYFYVDKIELHLRVLATAAIYQKVLKLSQFSLYRTSAGHIVNIASNDVHRFEQVVNYIMASWPAPIMLIVITYICYCEIGPSALLATLIILTLVPLQVMMGRLAKCTREKAVKETDKRVHVMSEVICAMRVIKMYAWEYAFKRVVDRLRRTEIMYIMLLGILRATVFATYTTYVTFSMFVTLSVFVATGGVLTPRKVFTVFSLYFLLAEMCVHCLATCFLVISEMQVSIRRIEAFLLVEEETSLDDDEDHMELSTDKSGDTIPLLKQSQHQYRSTSSPMEGTAVTVTPSIAAQHLYAAWGDHMILTDISFEVKMDEPLLIISGSVGSGKSTLLNCLLGELEPRSGRMRVDGRIAYASQVPWIFSDTLRENIVFGDVYDHDWYNTVLHACALEQDIAQLPDGDFTLVGERGVTLSGGQKARVNLARAVYHRADVYVLDDPLSAVDTGVAKHIFEICICGLLSNKLVVLVSHQLHFLFQENCRVMILDNGQVHCTGLFRELKASGQADILMEDQDFTIIEDEDNDTDGNVCIGELSRQSSIGSFSSVSTKKFETILMDHSEEIAHGSVSMKTYIKFFKAGASYCVLFICIVISITGQVNLVAADWWFSDWTTCTSASRTENTTQVYNLPTCSLNTTLRITIYGAITGGAILFEFLRLALLAWITIDASRVLHNSMLKAILRAPIRFFDTNPSGRILNRFSKDVGFLDDVLPHHLVRYFVICSLAVNVLVIVAVSIPWLIIPVAALLIIMLIKRWYYLKSARDLKRLEAISRSPMYSLLSHTLDGLATIRALEKEEVVMKRFHDFLNQHTRSTYLYKASSKWFAFRLQSFLYLLFIPMILLSVPLSTYLNTSLLGLSVAYISNLTFVFNYIIRLSAEVESLMISAERIMQYSALEPEAPLETIPPNEKPPDDWPQTGEIAMDDVCFRHSPDTPLVLKNFSCYIRPAEHVGIVGRTGAGKSSLLASLFRMAEPTGTIDIDGVNIQKLGLHDLRRRISIIPQDPILFIGTVRYNLDPFKEYDDIHLWNVLEEVQLKSVVEDLDGGLEAQVSEGGSNFSVGQRQLVCLARALLRRNKILVLDEATANVDMKTDAFVHQAIQEKFAACTVLTIAHRLDTVMGSSRVVVLKSGRIREFGPPYTLLKQPNSLLKRMVEQTGSFGSKKLHQMAMESYYH